MKLSAKAEYACLAILELARPGTDSAPLRIREIAAAQGIPQRYLVQILLQLKAAGLVQSARGSEGGYHLARQAAAISVADVVAAIDGPSEPLRKLISPEAQALSNLFGQARAAELNVLAGTSIAQLAVVDPPLDWVL